MDESKIDGDLEEPSTLLVRIDHSKLMTEQHAFFLPFSSIDCSSCRADIIDDNNTIRAKVDWINGTPEWL